MDFHFTPPIHPGEMLRTEYMEPLGLTSGQLAKALGVPRTRIERLVREETGISADTADRLARYFGSSVKFWLSMQSHYEIDCLRLDEAHERDIAKITPRPGLGDMAA